MSCMLRMFVWRGYCITLLKMTHLTSAKLLSMKEREFINAYVYLPKLHLKIFKEDNSLGNETFRAENTIGVDTAHYNNEEMSLEEKEKDAIRQIKEVIEEYEKVLQKL